MNSTLIEKQEKILTKVGDGFVFVGTIRFDDRCKNEHNTFSITGGMYDRGYMRNEQHKIGKNGKRYWLGSCGRMDEEFAQYFPEYADLLKWHLCSTDEPLHYIANTVYHAKNGNLEFAQSSAVWPDATLEDLMDKQSLQLRLPALLDEFRAAIESLGFVW